MTKFAIAFLLFLTACKASSELPAPAGVAGKPMEFNGSTIETFHDAEHGVTCWVTTGGYGGTSPAMSCLPDSQILGDTP